MEGDPPVIPTDFLQDLDLWLTQTSAAPPTASRYSLEASAANAAISSLEATVLAPLAPVTDTNKFASFVASLTDDTLPWAALAAFPIASGSTTLPPPAPRLPTPQKAAKTTAPKPTKARKGRPPAASKVTGASALEPPNKKGKPNKSTSQRQKEELAYLREKTEQLEVELETLKQHNREEVERQQREEEHKQGQESVGVSTAMVATTAGAFGAPIQPEFSLWERIAKRQREEKAKAEVENVKLREMVQSQMRLVKSFERLLRKRRIWEQLQESSNQSGSQDQTEEEMLASMLRDVDARYPRADSVLNEHGLGESDPAVDVTEDANMKYSPEDGMYFEYKEKKYMPFEYKVLDDVVWRSYGEGKLKLEDSQVSILRSTENVFYSRTLTPLTRKSATSNDKPPGHSHSFSVVKRFREESRVVYVWNANTSVMRPGDEGCSPVLLVQKGYAVMASATLPDGSSGCAVRSYTSSVPTFPSKRSESDSEQQQEQHREVGLLTEMVFAAYQQSRQSINQTLENLVLDEMMAKDASSTSAPTIPDTNVSV
ncbi:hypothetical protein GN244_ATG12889 [Phytophthora infestans]|uniref:M96 mating-specific protein family n=1 Tax=Phytophthora infestans TaxID=4787 RepID=A0A833S757_PHYIN|nr:hypothetical protein GN244_ATG12889 [Phytophthora infestans]